MILKTREIKVTTNPLRTPRTIQSRIRVYGTAGDDGTSRRHKAII
ncbi:hypothetical protein [Desulfobacter hydrogenophilus]|nr:hypothetical protein [Desulfobacter hydrogenophilus]